MAGKDATSHLEDAGATFDARTAPVAVKMPGHGKEAQHADRHNADRPGSTIKHVGHTSKRALQLQAWLQNVENVAMKYITC